MRHFKRMNARLPPPFAQKVSVKQLVENSIGSFGFSSANEARPHPTRKSFEQSLRLELTPYSSQPRNLVIARRLHDIQFAWTREEGTQSPEVSSSGLPYNERRNLDSLQSRLSRAPAEERTQTGPTYPRAGKIRAVPSSPAVVVTASTTEQRFRSTNSTAVSATLAMSSGVSSAYIGSEMILCA